jgi:NAD-dependent SIR2 family protein deacetylase
MNKESLFELIRKEEVVLFVGAGLSIYAGFPSGNELKKIFIENLTLKEKENIDLEQKLDGLTEDIYRIKGNNKNFLIEVLNKTFNKDAKSLKTHILLSKIPHFKTIITTNYDKLFEEAYKSKCQLIINEKQISNIDKTKSQIFKVHGDLSNPDSIILKKSDYNNFFKENSESSLFWTVLKERISTKNVAFLGYGLEDSNIEVIFDKISDVLGDNKKEIFLIAPNFSQSKQNHLNGKGIKYINSDADTFINELLINIKENIIDDLENNKVSADTFKFFLNNFNLKTKLTDDDNSYKVENIFSNEEVKQKVNFTLINNEEFLKNFWDFMDSHKHGEFEIPEEFISKSEIWIGDILMRKSDNIKNILIKTIPSYTLDIDLKFANGLEINDIKVEVYGKKTKEIKLEFKNAFINLTLSPPIDNSKNIQFEITFNHKENINNIKDEIEFYKILNCLGKGIEFHVYQNGNLKTSKKLPKMKPYLTHSNQMIKYFENLKSIENFYKIKFSNFKNSEINKISFEKVEKILSFIKGKKNTIKIEKDIIAQLIENYSDDIVNQFKNIEDDVIITNNEEEIITLHNHEINIGCKVFSIKDAVIKNLELVEKRIQNYILINSKSNTITEYYVKKNDLKFIK